ncbi:hypothetical protein PENPOL_c003G02924 [Penicillium polonicum]|uniref:Uncharacterized protein n=1 Tax=Penicillium polonicum TaxID=60169 RepID=A0A1V6NSL1_PENPO|nr:hypothetical protein PENPOL_c003G02924 [Penicillium polonicum]
MEQDKTVRDLFAEMAVQLERITSETPSIESDDSAVAFVHDSPTPQANTTQDSVAAQGSVSAAFQDCDAPKFDIDPFTTTHPSSLHFFPQLTTDGHESDGEPTSPVSLVPPVPHPPLLPSNLENKASNPPALSPKSPRQNTSSRWTTTQVPRPPVRSTEVPSTPGGGDSEEYFPTASHTVSSGSTNADKRATDVTPIATSKLGLVVNEPREDSTLESDSTSDSTDASESPTDVTPIGTSRLKLLVNEPREDSTLESDSTSDSTDASESPTDVTPIGTSRLKLLVNEPREDSTDASESPKDVTPTARPRRLRLFCKPKTDADSIPSTVPSDPVSSEHLSSPTKPGDQSSNMDPPRPSAESTSYESSSDYEASTSINATSEVPATSESPKPHSSSDEAPSRDAGYLSPLNFVPSTPPNPEMNPSLDPSMDPSMDPYMDPYQPTDSAVMPGTTLFEDPNVLPSTFTYPEETPDYSSAPIDPMGVYTPEQYARILASEQEVLREMADPHTDTPTYVYGRRVEQHYTTVADLDRIFAEMEAASTGIDILQPEYWAAIGRDLPGPSQPGALESNQPAHAQSASETLQSVEEAEPGSAKKRARHNSPEIKSSSPELSSTISVRTSVSNQRRSTSSKTKTASPPPASISTRRHSKNQAATPPAPTSASSRRRSKNKKKTEVATPEVPVTVSPRRLRSSDVMPSSSTKKTTKGNATPESWETAPTADKMMSQMKESSMSWTDITNAWNENRNESDDEMTWRALSKRWGRIKDRIGPWPGFDEVLLDTLGTFDPKLDDDDFAQIAEEVSSGLGWDVSSAACHVRYEALKEAGKIDVKGKGRARK